MITSIEKNRLDWSLLLIRIVAGGFMLYGHGLPKLKLLLAGGEIKFPDPLGLGDFTTMLLAIFSEFFCALLILIGFKTRLATIPALVTMFVAGFVYHFGDPFKKTELSLIYLLLYVVILLLGPGRFSLDHQKWAR